MKKDFVESLQVINLTKLSRILKRNLSLFLLASTIVVVISCGHRSSTVESKSSDSSQSQGPDLEVKIKTEGDAINAVQYVVSQEKKTITLQVPYSGWETVHVPCSQFDVDTDPNKDDENLCRCKPKGGAAGAPYGYRTKQEKVTKCCISKEIPIYSTTGSWRAVEKGNEWSVEMEFGVEDVKKILTWSIDRTGKVSEPRDANSN